MVRIKICCIKSLEEARTAIELGAHVLGLVSHMPSGPGVIGDHDIRAIAAAVPAPVETFLLTSRTKAGDIIDQARACGTTSVQLVDHVGVEAYAAIRQALPKLKLVQVIHVQDQTALAEARQAAPLVDRLLLDSGRPQAARKELGGTGRVHDWAVSRQIVAEVACPVFLAGGLGPDNVGDAITRVRPYGVDLCSSVRTDDVLDKDRLTAFMAAVSQAGASQTGAS